MQESLPFAFQLPVCQILLPVSDHNIFRDNTQDKDVEYTVLCFTEKNENKPDTQLWNFQLCQNAERTIMKWDMDKEDSEMLSDWPYRLYLQSVIQQVTAWLT
jgi:hypothetical protein